MVRRRRRRLLDRLVLPSRLLLRKKPNNAAGSGSGGGEGVKYEDYAITAFWNAGDDERRVENLFTLIQDGRLGPADFENRLERAYNDQTVRFEDGRLFEPVIVTPRKYDMITFTGMIRIAQLVTGRSSQYFTFFASGTGVSEEKLSDIRLQAENFRVSMISDGFAEPAGIVMKFAGKFPSTVPTATITEGGVFDLGTVNAGTMLFRTVYPQEARLPHVQFRSFYTLSQAIHQVSIT
jgi:hypothetical protein